MSNVQFLPDGRFQKPTETVEAEAQALGSVISQILQGAFGVPGPMFSSTYDLNGSETVGPEELEKIPGATHVPLSLEDLFSVPLGANIDFTALSARLGREEDARGTYNNQAMLLKGWDSLSDKIRAELERQYNKWGDQYHTVHEWMGISMEELGEAFKALNEHNMPECGKEIAETIACLYQTYHEVQRVESGLDKTTGEYKKTNLLPDGTIAT